MYPTITGICKCALLSAAWFPISGASGAYLDSFGILPLAAKSVMVLRCVGMSSGADLFLLDCNLAEAMFLESRIVAITGY